jgi:hypothetical protein
MPHPTRPQARSSPSARLKDCASRSQNENDDPMQPEPSLGVRSSLRHRGKPVVAGPARPVLYSSGTAMTSEPGEGAAVWLGNG